MPFIPVPNTVQVEFRFTWNGEEVENTLYFHNDAGWSPSNMSALAAVLFDWWDENYKPLQAVTVTLREIYLRDLANSTSWVYTYVPAGTAVGTAGGLSAPNNVTLCVSFRSLQAGRSFRGRNYTVGMTVNHFVGSVATATYVNSVENAYTAIQTYTDPLSVSHMIVSRYTNGNARPSGIVTNVSQYVVVDSHTDSQRRRLPGRGA